MSIHLLSISDDVLACIASRLPLSSIARLMASSPSMRRRLHNSVTVIPQADVSENYCPLNPIPFLLPFRRLKSFHIPNFENVSDQEATAFLKEVLSLKLTYLSIPSTDALILLTKALELAHSHLDDASKLATAISLTFSRIEWLALLIDRSAKPEDWALATKYLAFIPVTHIGTTAEAPWNMLVSVLSSGHLRKMNLSYDKSEPTEDFFLAMKKCESLVDVRFCATLTPELVSCLPPSTRVLDISNCWPKTLFNYFAALPRGLLRLRPPSSQDDTAYLSDLPRNIESFSLRVNQTPEHWKFLPRRLKAIKLQERLTPPTALTLHAHELPPFAEELESPFMTVNFLAILPFASQLIKLRFSIGVGAILAHRQALPSPTKQSDSDYVKEHILGIFSEMTLLKSLKGLTVDINPDCLPMPPLRALIDRLDCQLNKFNVNRWERAELELLDWSGRWANQLVDFSFNESQQSSLPSYRIETPSYIESMNLRLASLILGATVISSSKMFALLPRHLIHLVIGVDQLDLDDLALLPRYMTHFSFRASSKDATEKRPIVLHTTLPHLIGILPPELKNGTIQNALLVVHEEDRARLARLSEKTIIKMEKSKNDRIRLASGCSALTRAVRASRPSYPQFTVMLGCLFCE